MIDFEAPNFECNADILLDGIYYADLPDIVDWERIKSHMKKVLEKIKNQKYRFYEFDKNGLIKDFKAVSSPDYIRRPGVEAISFYSFKKDGAFREMQMPNLVHYCAFIYNSLYVFDEIFRVLYLNAENEKYISHSNSYVVIGENFVIPTGYNMEEELEEGVFITKNNKNQGRMSFGENRRRYHDCQDTYLYSVKIDIESFFPNLYTHYFEKITKFEPYRQLGFDAGYFSFLDIVHQRMNHNQTKGIPAGLFSSHIAAELLMLCVDYDILEKLNRKEMDYIRYVDDMVFFSDSKEELEAIVSDVQRILGKYRLRMNGAKTAYYENAMYTPERSNIINIYARLPFLKMEDKISLKEEDYYDFKEYITELLRLEKTVQVKTVMSLLLKGLKRKKISLGGESEGWFCYLFTLAFQNVNFVCHVYRLLDVIMDQAADALKENYLLKLRKKTRLIESKYTETLFQIWHYYVITKYMGKTEKMQCLSEYAENENVNPIILCMFVERGSKKNAKLLQIITKQMENESDGKDWKQKIMFSRWWLPLMKVRMEDSYNYYGFLQSESFPEVIADLIGEG